MSKTPRTKKAMPPIVSDYRALIAKADAAKDGESARRYRVKAERLYNVMSVRAQRLAGIAS